MFTPTTLKSKAIRLTVTASLAVGTIVGVIAATSNGASATTAAGPTCTSAKFIVARGTFEVGTLGFIVGDRVDDQLNSRAPGVFSATAIDYPANTDADSPKKGNLALVAAVNAAIAACPNQKIVISGYSQGAQVVDESFGIDMTGTINGGIPSAVLPASAASHIAAVVLFGNPLGSLGKQVTGTYANRTKDYCASGDPVCNANQINIFAHLSYFLNASDAATFILSKL